MNTAHNLQSFFGKTEDAVVNVDLLKIGKIHGHHISESSKSNNKKQQQNGKYRIALDMEHCLDRCYGGYYSDWACGGQWNRALQFVQLLANAFSSAQIEIIVFFDGTLKNNKILQHEQSDIRHKIISVLKHIRVIGTPPPKIWWLPPSGIQTFLRNALRSINIQVMQTVNDHTGEVIDYFHEHKLNAVLGLNSDYIFSNITHYYSSHDLRLSYKGSLETKEFIIQTFLKSNDTTAETLPYLAIFLNQANKSNAIEEDILKKLYEQMNIDYNLDFEGRLKKIMEILKKNPCGDIDEFIKIHNLCDNFKVIKDCYNYYQSKIKGKKYVLNNIIKNQKNAKLSSAAATTITPAVIQEKEKIKEILKHTPEDSVAKPAEIVKNDLTKEIGNSIVEKKENIGKESNSTIETKVKEEKDDKTVKENKEKKSENASGSSGDGNNKKAHNIKKEPKPALVYVLPGEVIKTAINRHQRGIMDSRIYHLLSKKEIILPQILEDEQYRDVPSINLFYRPARQMIYATLFNLYHQKYLCSQHSNSNNNNKKNKNNSNEQFIPEVIIKEWIWKPQNEYKEPDSVNAVCLPWAVPTVQRLWFGTSLEDKQRRMKAFLTIMRSDTPLMLNRGYVPQHMLVMACVIRYIMTFPENGLLTRNELDAFLATAFSVQLNNVEYTQELTLPGVNVRGVFLASLFTQGIETASLANDACGVPLPWIMTNPWLFFDGKLFHLKLKMSTYVQNLRELCDDQIEIVMKIERFRKAILEGLDHNIMPTHDLLYRQAAFVHSNLAQQFSKSPYSALSNIPPGNFYTNAANQTNFYTQPTLHLTREGNYIHRPGKILNNRGFSRIGAGGGITGIHQRGYQLKVGGIVVGSWAEGITNRSLNYHRKIMNLARNTRNNQIQRGNRQTANNRMRVTMNGPFQSRGISRHSASGRQNRNRKNNKKKTQKKDKDAVKAVIAVKKEEKSDTESNVPKIIKEKPKTTVTTSVEECTVELQNGTTVLASEIANAMCDNILKEEPIIDTNDDNDENELNSKSLENSPSKGSPLKKIKNITWQQPLALLTESTTITTTTITTTTTAVEEKSG